MRGLKFVLCAVLAVFALAVPAQANHGGVHALIVDGPPAFASSTSATFEFISDSDTTVDSCKLDDQAPTSCSKPSKTYTNLAPGTHSVTVDGTWHHNYCDIAGCFYEPFPRTDSWTWTIDVTKPTVTMTSPSKPFQLDSNVTVTWTGSDGAGSGIKQFTLARKRAPFNGAFGATSYVALAAGVTSTTRQLAAGSTDCFAIRAIDNAGNASAFSPLRCTTLPLDDRSLARSAGWTLGTSSAYFNSTFTRATTVGRTVAKSGAQVKRIGLVAMKCASCGSVAVKVGPTTIAAVNLYSPTTKYKQVITLPPFSLRTGTVSVATTTSGKPIHIDGLALSRQ